jgi:Tol biopolymer transport system component
MNHLIQSLKLGTWYLLLGTVLLLSACNQSAEVLPTAIDLNAISTNDAATRLAQTAVAANATATRDAEATRNAPPTLPPTWTPAAPPTEPPAQATPVPLTVAGVSGTLYYIFNGDSIALLFADGSHEELILTGGAPADLVLSPDEQWLAFTRQASDTVREVYVMSIKTDGVPADQQYQVRQISCLGFANVVYPTWSADSLTVAFAASKSTNDPLGIYTAENNGQCPDANHQRGVVQTQFKTITGMVWNPNGAQLYLASGTVFAVDAAKGTLFPPLTQPTGYGPDSYPVFRPNSTALFYLKTDLDEQTGIKSGVLSQVDITQFGTFPLQELRGTMLFAQQFQFSHDGRLIVAAGLQDAYVQNMDVGSAVKVVADAKFPPQAVFSPDAEQVAYVDAGTGANLIQQVWTVNRRGTDRRQLTGHIEGTISSLNWAAQ